MIGILYLAQIQTKLPERKSDFLLSKFKDYHAVFVYTLGQENHDTKNKLAKARKTRKSPGTLGLKSFGRVSFGSKKFGQREKLRKN